jgi:hypothetical protein
MRPELNHRSGRKSSIRGLRNGEWLEKETVVVIDSAKLFTIAEGLLNPRHVNFKFL